MVVFKWDICADNLSTSANSALLSYKTLQLCFVFLVFCFISFRAFLVWSFMPFSYPVSLHPFFPPPRPLPLLHCQSKKKISAQAYARQIQFLPLPPAAVSQHLAQVSYLEAGDSAATRRAEALVKWKVKYQKPQRDTEIGDLLTSLESERHRRSGRGRGWVGMRLGARVTKVVSLLRGQRRWRLAAGTQG